MKKSEILLSSYMILQNLAEVSLRKLMFQLVNCIMKALIERMIVQNCIIKLPIQSICLLF